jgi:hypothetical protein
MVEGVSAARANGAQGEEVVLAAAWRADGAVTDKRSGRHCPDWSGDWCQSHMVTRQATRSMRACAGIR